MGQASSQPGNTQKEFEEITQETFFLLDKDKTNYVVGEIYKENSSIKTSEQLDKTIESVVLFLNDLQILLQQKSPLTVNKNDKSFKFLNYLYLFGIVDKKQTINSNNRSNANSKVATGTGVNTKDTTNATKDTTNANITFTFIDDNLTQTDFISVLTKFIDQFTSIQNRYDATKEPFKKDENDSPEIRRLKTSISDNFETVGYNMKFFDFDYYVINFIEYMYMFYSIRVFKEITKLRDELKEELDLGTINRLFDRIGDIKRISNTNSKTEHTLFLKQTKSIIDHLDNIKTPKTTSGGTNTNTNTSSNMLFNTTNNSDKNKRVENIINVYEKKKSLFQKMRLHLLSYIDKINDVIITKSLNLEEMYKGRFKDLLTNKETLEKLQLIEKTLENGTTFIDMIPPQDVTQDMSQKDKDDYTIRYIASLDYRIKTLLKNAENKLKDSFSTQVS